MRPFSSTLPLADALTIIAAHAHAIERTESVTLDEGHGRVLADAVVADHDVPPFDRAAMDGYAVRAADAATASDAQPAALHEVGVVYSGEVAARGIDAGECLEIATGAPLPSGADAVVTVEHTVHGENGTILVRAPVARGDNIGRRGADIRSGAAAIHAGVVLTPARIGSAAALGRTHLRVFARPRVLVASTGNEVVEPGRPLGPGQIYDVNRFTLAPLIQAHGGIPIAHHVVGDTLDALAAVLDAGAGLDLIVFSGGSSVGDRDLLVDAVSARGDLLVHGIAVKPGKPTLFGRVGSTLVLGMPGNPTSCLSNGYILLVPLLRRMARLPPWQPITRVASLASDVKSVIDRHQFYPVRLDGDLAVPAFKGSGEITSLSHADGYIEIPLGIDRLPAGTRVQVTVF